MITNNPTILYVEDDPLLSEALTDKFTRDGFTILTAKNGEEGLATAVAQHPALILSDIIMPKMHGLEMLKQLRADPWGASVPVFILSNLSASPDIAEAKKYGVVEFIIKADFTLNEIVAKVSRLLVAS